MIAYLSDPKNWALIIAGLVVIVIMYFQWKSFLSTKSVINKIIGFFPKVSNLKVVKYTVSSETLKTEDGFKNFLYKPQDDELDPFDEDIIEVSQIKISGEVDDSFKDMIMKTNAYLCKNAGTTAELSVLTDICDHQHDSMEEEVHNALNVPLFLGLAGTFTGIILGLIGVDFEEIFSSGSANNLVGLQHLLYGVVGAMCASLMGLALTVYNSAISFKTAVSKSSSAKDDYFDFLRRELIPTLSNSMSQSLNSLKGVLGHFVDKFGRNLDAYANSATMLNDNLEKQHLVLVEINKLSMTETATKIAESFKTLKESSESLEVFKSYQTQLNTTIKNMNNAVNQMDSLISGFDSFKAGLNAVVRNQDKHDQLEQQFKEAIETHFPTGGEAREAWRTEFDTLISDAKNVTGQLSEQLSNSTQYIKTFVEENNSFFDTFDKVKEIVASLVQYTQVQATCYNDLKQEIVNLRKDYKESQIDAIELNKATQQAVREMTKALKDNKNNE
ncbi:MAG: hypothetical protein NC335_07915 [Bacteroides sp.]|nr:hypothetical protein [Bacteroides sp.]